MVALEEFVGSPGTLALGGLIGLATAAVFAYVGRLMLSRPAEGRANRRALGLFATWWFSLSVLTLAGSTQSLLAAAGVTALLPHAILSVFGVFPLVAALWALLYYLLFIYTGNERLLAPLTLAYAAVLGWFLYVVWWLHPVGIDAGAWSVSLRYERTLEGPLLATVLGVLLGPVLAAASLYGSLFFRTRNRAVRYRIGMVSTAFLLWFGSSGVASAAGWGDAWWWPPASRLVGLVATLMVLAAYRPPRLVRERLDVEEMPPPARDAPDWRPRHAPTGTLRA